MSGHLSSYGWGFVIVASSSWDWSLPGPPLFFGSHSCCTFGIDEMLQTLENDQEKFISVLLPWQFIRSAEPQKAKKLQAGVGKQCQLGGSKIRICKYVNRIQLLVI